MYHKTFIRILFGYRINDRSFLSECFCQIQVGNLRINKIISTKIFSEKE